MRDSIRALACTAALAAAVFLAGPASAQNEAAVVYITGGTVTEGDAGTRTVTFNIVCDPCDSVNAIVGWSTIDGTATVADNDYVARSGSIDDLGNGLATETYPVEVAVNGDTAVEADEIFSLRITSASVGCPSLGGPGGCSASPTSAIAAATIVNDDSTPEPPDEEPDDEPEGWPLWLILILLLILLLLWIKKKK